MLRTTALLMMVGALGAGSATQVSGQDAPAELALLNGDHRVPVVAFGPSAELQVGQFDPPASSGDFFFVAEREAFFHPDIDKMGGQQTTSGAATGTSNVASSASGAASSAAVASSAAGAAGETPAPATTATPQWRSVGAHAFELLHDGTTYNCMAGKISEDSGQASSLGDGAVDLEDPRLYRVQCMGWTVAE